MQVERVFGAGHPDPLEIEKAKKMLKVRKHLIRLSFSSCSLFSLPNIEGV